MKTLIPRCLRCRKDILMKPLILFKICFLVGEKTRFHHLFAQMAFLASLDQDQ